MTLGVQDRIYLQVRIGGLEVPAELNMIDTIHIVESVRIYVPMMTLVIKDITKFFTYNNVLVDGAPIEVIIESSKQREVYYFRLFNHKEDTPQGTLTYTIQAYLDVPRYWTESPASPILGSVSGVLTEIARATRMTYDGPVTADSQLWAPANRKYAEFARDISEHAWVSDTSCCQLVVLANKVMRLRDVSKVITQTPVQFFSNKENSYEQTVITDYRVLNTAGLYNASTGYRDSRVVQSLSAADIELKDLKLVRNSNKLMLNQAIHDNIVQNRVAYAPIDVGNVSQTYEQAIYQNRRTSNLFTFGLEFVTTRPVEAQVLDVVNCELAKPEIDGVEAYNGKYLLTSKVTYVVGLNKYVKCEVFRHGLNTREDTQV